MSQSSLRSRCGRKGLLRRFFAVVGSLAIVLVTMVSLPWTAPSADAATGELDVPLGDTSAQIGYVRTIQSSDRITDTASDGRSYTSYPWEWGRTRACIRYTPGSNLYWTDMVRGSSGQYAAVGYGRPRWEQNSCPDVYKGEAADRSQTSLGFQPSDTTSVKVGQVFLVGRMRHVNSPVYTSHLLRYQRGHQPGQAGDGLLRELQYPDGWNDRGELPLEGVRHHQHVHRKARVGRQARHRRLRH